MQIATPVVHLEKQGSSTYHIHVVTWFDYTKFKANGYNTISTTATGGVFSVTVLVTEDTGVPNMQLLTPVIHTLTLTGITLNSTNPFIEVKVVNSKDSSEVGKRKTHMDSAGSSAMPDPGSANRT